MNTAGQIAQVSLAALPSHELRGCGIDAPQEGDELETYALEVRGWALGARSRVAAVELLREGTPISHAPCDLERPDIRAEHPDVPGAESSGFRVSTTALRLSPRFELTVEAVFEDGGRAQLGAIRGTRRALRSDFEPRLRPLMVTSLGRAGSTLIMRLLEAHPQVLTYRPFQYEPRVATYWIGVLRTLSEPVSYLRQLSDARNLDYPDWWLGRDAPMPRDLPDPAIQEWMGTGAVEEVAAFCQSRIEALYERIGAEIGRERAGYFAEKYIPDSVQALVWELYPKAREVVLVRDFRDMLCSMFAFNEKRGIQGFRRSRSGSDEEYVLQNVGQSVSTLVHDWQTRSDRAHLIRYEDLVLRPDQTLAGLTAYLGLDGSPAVLRAMIENASLVTPEMQWHRTTAGPEASIGRWRHDLPGALRDACEKAFGAALDAFGYPVDGDAAAAGGAGARVAAPRPQRR